METHSAANTSNLRTDRSFELSEASVEPTVNTGTSRVAVVHDWLTGMRGGEIALENILALIPDADLFTLLHNPGSVSATIEAFKPKTTFINRLPFASTKYRNYLPLFPMAIEQLDLDAYDVIISTSHCVAKSAIPAGSARHLCYCFTPMRYAWDQFDSYFGADQIGRWKSHLYRLAMAKLSRWDAATSSRVHRYIAISEFVANRIRRYYGREPDVIYPPVNTDFYTPGTGRPGDYFVVVSALVPYKRVDIAIKACAAAKVPLRIVGDGPEITSLKAYAGPDVDFLPHQTGENLRELYRNSRGFLLPGEEDFGIAPVEALACGRPVIALSAGGARETVEDGVTGLLVKDDTVDGFTDAVNDMASFKYDPVTLHQAATRFSTAAFQKRMSSALNSFFSQNTKPPSQLSTKHMLSTEARHSKLTTPK